MEIMIKSCLDGAKEAEGTSVILDVFRSSNTIIACMDQGAEYIIPVEELNKAYNLKKENPDHLLFAERKGLTPEGSDYGNSPAIASRLDLKDKKIILTTSAGSQGIVHAKKSEEILIGSFANAKAVVEYIKIKKPNKVSLIAIGLEANMKADEDELCAEYLKEQLIGMKSEFKRIKQEILKCDGANRLRRLKQEDDLDFSMKLDIYNIVPKYNLISRKIVNQKRPF